MSFLIHRHVKVGRRNPGRDGNQTLLPEELKRQVKVGEEAMNG